MNLKNMNNGVGIHYHKIIFEGSRDFPCSIGSWDCVNHYWYFTNYIPINFCNLVKTSRQFRLFARTLISIIDGDNLFEQKGVAGYIKSTNDYNSMRFDNYIIFKELYFRPGGERKLFGYPGLIDASKAGPCGDLRIYALITDPRFRVLLKAFYLLGGYNKKALHPFIRWYQYYFVGPIIGDKTAMIHYNSIPRLWDKSYHYSDFENTTLDRRRFYATLRQIRDWLRVCLSPWKH